MDKISLTLIFVKAKLDDGTIVDGCDISDNSDECGNRSRKPDSKSSFSSNQSSSLRRNNLPPSRFGSGDKKSYSRPEPNTRQNSSGSLRSSQVSARLDGKKDHLSGKPDKIHKSKENLEDVDTGTEADGEEKSVPVCDSEGFQEVKSKKTGQRQKSAEDTKLTSKAPSKIDKGRKNQTKMFL